MITSPIDMWWIVQFYVSIVKVKSAAVEQYSSSGTVMNKIVVAAF